MAKSTIRALPLQLKHTTNAKRDTRFKEQQYDIARRMASGLEHDQLAMVRSSLASNDSATILHVHPYIIPPVAKVPNIHQAPE